MSRSSGQYLVTSILPPGAQMSAHTAVSIFLVALLLLLLALRRERLTRVLAYLVIAYMTAFLVEYTTGASLGLDDPFGLNAASADTAYPGRPALITCVSITGLAVACLAASYRRAWLAQLLGVVPSVLAYTGTLGYLMGHDRLYASGLGKAMPLNTAICIFLLSLALYTVTIRSGWARLFINSGIGGVTLRRTLPGFIILPALLAIVVVHTATISNRATTILGLAMVFLTMVGCASLWSLAAGLERLEDERVDVEVANQKLAQAKRKLAQANAKLSCSERLARKIVDEAADAYVAVDRDGFIIDWNPAMVALTGWSHHEVMGQHWTQRYQHPDVAHLVDDAPGMLPQVGCTVETRVPTAKGETVPVEVRMWTVEDEGKRTYHLFYRDITEQVRARTELRAANRDLQDFAAVAAHDLQTPFVAILGNAEMLREECQEGENSDAEMMVSHIERAANRGVRLIRDLLSFTQAGQSADPPQTFDLEVLAQEVLADLRDSHDRDFAFETDGLVEVCGWPGGMRQVLTNLISNAIKYCPDDRLAMVQVSGRKGPGGRLEVRVEDNGLGVPESERDKLFEMFQRGSTTSGLRGSGIGLSICRRVIEKHEGRVWIEDAPLGGAAFCFTLPQRLSQLEKQ